MNEIASAKFNWTIKLTHADWNELSTLRLYIFVVTTIVCGTVALGKIVLDPKITFSNELVTVLAVGIAIPFPQLRNNKRYVIAVVAAITVMHIVACAGVITLFVTGHTFWYSYETHPGLTSVNLPATTTRICVTPLLVMFGTVCSGLSHRSMTRIGIVMLVSGALALAAVTLHSPRYSNSMVITTIAWGLSPGLYGLAMMHALNKRTQQVRVLANKELEQQHTAAANQIRTVGYIFHEVRNPINNIMLACELVRNLLAAHTTSPNNNNNADNISFVQPNFITSPPMPNLSATGVPLATTNNNKVNDDEGNTTGKCNASSLHQLDEEVTQLIQDIHQSAGAAVRVLNDALNLQRLQSGTFEFVHRPFLLGDLVTSTVRMVLPQMKAKNIQVITSIARDVESVAVDGDFHRLQQVVLNYLSNAYKFTPAHGEVQVRMRRLLETEASNINCNINKINSSSVHSSGSKAAKLIERGDGMRDTIRVRTSVVNTGSSIGEEDRARLFRPWSQIRAGEQQQQQGSGLGLALCKAFVEKGHNGCVGVECSDAPSSSSATTPTTEFYFDIVFTVSSARLPPPLKSLTSQPNTLRLFASSTTSLMSDHSTLELALLSANVFNKEDLDIMAQSQQDLMSNTNKVSTNNNQLNDMGMVDDGDVCNGAGIGQLNHHQTMCEIGDSNHNDNSNDNSNHLSNSNPSTNDVQQHERERIKNQCCNKIVNNNNNNNIYNTTTTINNNCTIASSCSGSCSGYGARDEGHVVDVLIVEDSVMSRRLLSKTLKGMGVTSEQVTDGVEAIERVEQVGIKYFGVILMDKEMPRMDGYEATRKLRAMGFHKPIIGCTGNVLDIQVKEFMQAGVNHVLGKPLSQDAIALSLQRAGLTLTSHHTTLHDAAVQ